MIDKFYNNLHYIDIEIVQNTVFITKQKDETARKIMPTSSKDSHLNKSN